jgi:ABC-2 type transport system permease protein
MSATIYMHEFRSRLKSVVIWSLSTTALILLFFSIFPGFADQAGLIDEMMSKFPEAFREAFGLGKIDLATPLGFYGFLFIFVQLCLAIQAGNYGFGLVSIEESEMTADFLLSKPVSRMQIMNSKLLAALSSLTITNLVIWAATFISFALFHGKYEYDTGRLILLLSSIVIFQLFFLSIGLVVSLLVKRLRSVTPYSLGLGFGMYVLSAFSGVFADVKLEYLTAFKHLDPSYIVNNGAYDTPLVLLNAGITLVSLVVSYWLYIRRDIPMVS